MIVKYKKGDVIFKFEVPDGARRCLDEKDIDGNDIYEGDYLEKFVGDLRLLYRAAMEGCALGVDADRYLRPKQLQETRLC